jgi:hypothetical protein
VVLIGKTEGKKPRLTWEDNIKVHLEEMGWEDIDRIIWLRIQTSCGMLLRQ